MDKHQQILIRLLQKLERLNERQESFSKEINELREEISLLQVDQKIQVPDTQEQITENEQDSRQPEVLNILQKRRETKEAKANQQLPKEKKPSKIKADLEKFIGENLINKIGIAITVIGVAIGAKYSIEHELISPLTRIILGYLFVFVILLFLILIRFVLS